MIKKLIKQFKKRNYCKICNGAGKITSTPTRLNIQIYETTCGVCYGTGKKKNK